MTKRRTVDLPDDLAKELETMHSHLKISQIGLLIIAGYSLAARYKMYGSALFETQDTRLNNNITLIESLTTRENVRFVQNHIAEFGTIKSIRVFGLNNIPERYHVPTLEGKEVSYNDYKLIIENNEGHEWWFAGCTCGYGGEGVRGTHEILTMLGIPFPFRNLATQKSITIDRPVQDHSLRLDVYCYDKKSKELSGKYLLRFPSASHKFQFEQIIEYFGIVTSYPSFTEEDENEHLWAKHQNIELTRRTELDRSAFELLFFELLDFLVCFQLRGEIQKI